MEAGRPEADTAGVRAVVLFDGVCNLCNSAVWFLIVHDVFRRLRFAPLQSDAGCALLARHGMTADATDTFVVIERGRALTRSDAALAVTRHLPPPWGWAALALRWLPRGWRDAVYACVARRRYRWFGRRDTCMVPGKDLRDRFIE
jgi:predicted DCC family thiol-disulfide oxidoreductase YuxK